MNNLGYQQSGCGPQEQPQDATTNDYGQEYRSFYEKRHSLPGLININMLVEGGNANYTTKTAAIPNLELDGASRKLRTLVIVNLSYESTNLMSGEPLCNFREAYIWNCCKNCKGQED
jgi:hypothetical protein